MKTHIRASLLLFSFFTLLSLKASVGYTQTGITVSLPVIAEDAANNSFGLLPFGIHIGDHGVDGHPGWDVEYRIGASVRAAAGGVIQSVVTDIFSPDKKTIQIQHNQSGRNFRTIYTNIGEVAQGIAAGVAVTAGQPIGVAGTVTLNPGGGTVTYAMTHFQLDDFSYSGGLTNKSAVSPEHFLSADGKALFETIWNKSAYEQELVEPFPSNPRNVTFPQTRLWNRQSGGLAARIEIKRVDGMTNGFEYALFAADGAMTEIGKAALRPRATQLSTIDLISNSGQTRQGVYDVVGDTMRIEYGQPGTVRPTSLANASVYKTARNMVASVSSASYSGAAIAPDSIVAAFGTGLASAASAATATPLPTAISGTTIKVRDSAGAERQASLFFVSPTQVNYLMPALTAPGAATVTVIEGSGVVSQGSAQIAPVAPGIFTANASGQGLAAAVALRIRADGSQTFEPVVRFDSALGQVVAVPIDPGAETDQVFLILNGTGFRFRSNLSAVAARIGGVDAQVSYAGEQGSFFGLDQLNARLPRSLAGRGEVDVAVTVDGQAGNVVKISIR